jgi:hypothetical protein
VELFSHNCKKSLNKPNGVIRIHIAKKNRQHNGQVKKCKRSAVQLTPILQKIFQVSIDTGDLPKDWRDANISSIFKKGDKHLPETYRPVSLTSVPCKLLEHIGLIFV